MKRARRIVQLASIALSLFLSTAHAAGDQTWAQWRTALVKGKMDGHIPKIAAQIQTNVPGARTAKPADFTYGNPAARDAIVGNVVAALEGTPADTKAAVDSWKKLFRQNNILWAHTAGYEADPAVLREIAAFWAVENAKLRDANAKGSFAYRLWDAAVTAAEQLHVEYLAEEIRTTLSSNTISGSNIDRDASPLPTVSAVATVGVATGAGMLRD